MDTTETTIYHAVVITCIVIGIILLCFFMSVIYHQRQNMALRKKIMLREISGLEKDRARIAADLHDELGPALAAVKMQVNNMELSNTEDLRHLEETNILINVALKRMREISFNLLPGILLKKGLIQALDGYIHLLNGENTIRFTFIAPDDCLFNEDKSVNIYRMAQEVLYNALKHSKATYVSVELRNKSNILQLKISDNGVGFDYKKKLAERSGIGLGSLSNRTAIAGGKMFVESGPDKGATYLFEIPL